MGIEIAEEQSGGGRTLVHISILLAVAFCIGTYLISTTVLVSKDGITFIEYAKGLEFSPIEAMKGRDQHPGYPFLIVAAHGIANVLYDGFSVQKWIYSAQLAALVFRLLSILLLYFIGRKIVGAKFSFWAVLVLIVLPEPAKLGSDCLSDWPHLFFLSGGFLLLIWGALSNRWWLFGFSGLAAGIGYLIRPECVQIVVFAALWLGLQLFWSQRTMMKGKIVFAFVLLLVGFFAAAGPYMKLKGAFFPKKQLVETLFEPEFYEISQPGIPSQSSGVYTSSLAPSDIAGATGKLIERISETLMWFFVPALLIGIYKHFRKRDWREPELFFVIILVVLNVAIMILLYCKFGYMSRRHTLPLVVFTIFYIPAGLEALAQWLDKRFSEESNINFWFFVLMAIGISICSPKLLRPMRAEKKGYREAAQWLAENTERDVLIAATDPRISFYAERKGVKYDGHTIPKEAEYAVKVFGDDKDMPSDEEMLQREVFSIGGDGKKPKVVIYKCGD